MQNIVYMWDDVYERAAAFAVNDEAKIDKTLEIDVNFPRLKWKSIYVCIETIIHRKIRSGLTPSPSAVSFSASFFVKLSFCLPLSVFPVFVYKWKYAEVNSMKLSGKMLKKCTMSVISNTKEKLNIFWIFPYEINQMEGENTDGRIEF